MTLVLCVDARGGLFFHDRRQSQDRCLRADLLKEAEGRRLFVTPYTARQFSSEEFSRLTVCEFLPEAAEEDDLLFLETRNPAPFLDRANQLLLYRWNRVYPADESFTPSEPWRLTEQLEIPGFSHETIGKERYTL